MFKIWNVLFFSGTIFLSFGEYKKNMNNWLIWVVKCWGNNSLLLSAMRYCLFRLHILRCVRMVCIYILHTHTHKLHAGSHCVRSNRATIYSIFIRIYCSIYNEGTYSHYDINTRTSNEYRCSCFSLFRFLFGNILALSLICVIYNGTFDKSSAEYWIVVHEAPKGISWHFHTEREWYSWTKKNKIRTKTKVANIQRVHFIWLPAQIRRYMQRM